MVGGGLMMSTAVDILMATDLIGSRFKIVGTVVLY